MTGQTVIASEVAQRTRASLEATLLTALLVELLILILYLRAIVAPVVLLACSALSVIAALGLTTLLFQIVLGQGLTFYAPFAAAVLLIALGSDYNVFRQIAFAMTIGLLIDTLVVRPVLTPAVLTLLGKTASWPSHRITTEPTVPR